MNIAQAQAIKHTKELAEELLVRMDRLSKRVENLEAREVPREISKFLRPEPKTLTLPKAPK